MKYLLIVGAVVLIGGAWLFLGGNDTPSGNNEGIVREENKTAEEVRSIDVTRAIPVGNYMIDASKSVVNWAAKKPLIDGYINSGTIKVSEGKVMIGATSITGSFTMDMNTLDVGLTAKKPGQEGKLEEHLKADRFFDVAKYPTATFMITKVAPVANPSPTQTHTLTGDLTMKDQKHAITFPAVVSEENGMLFAKATTEIDRTKWGLTAGSKNFFENLGDNMIDDMIGLTISLEAKKQ